MAKEIFQNVKALDMTYDSIKMMLEGYATPRTATNGNGESVIIERIFDSGNDNCYRVTTAQNNGWCRINEYYADGTISETYDR